jgi:hypothetical protein
VLVGDQAPPADFDVGQVAATHLVVEQIAGQASQEGGLVDGLGQPPTGRALPGMIGGRDVAVRGHPVRTGRGRPGWIRFPVAAPTGPSGH